VIAAVGADVVEFHPIRASPYALIHHLLDVGLPELTGPDELDVPLSSGSSATGEDVARDRFHYDARGPARRRAKASVLPVLPGGDL